MIVCKFGGTSIGDAPAVRRLAGIVQSRLAERPLVVLSALSGVTNALLGLLKHTAPSEQRTLAHQLAELVARHRQLARALELSEELGERIADEGQQLLARLAARPDPAGADELCDFVAAQGELWSTRLVAAALAAAGLESVWVDARSVMRTDAHFTRAAPDRAVLDDLAPRQFLPLLERGKVPVTQGYIGATADGRTTTLGRGGSDYSAALLGAALHAARVEIWTDVDGLMTADPRLVPAARVLPVASHLEAAELAAFGAQVLHPATQAPLVEARIPCVVLNSFAPERPGTIILAGVRPAPVGAGESPVRSISCKRGITVLNVRSPASRGSTGFLRALFAIFEQHGITVDVIATSEVNVSVSVEDNSRIEALRQDLERLGDVSVFPHRAIVAVVGIGLRGIKGLAGRIFTAVQSVNVEVISQGASEINVTFVVREEDAGEAVRRLHAALIEAAA
jgi:aspartate kinase